MTHPIPIFYTSNINTDLLNDNTSVIISYDKYSDLLNLLSEIFSDITNDLKKIKTINDRNTGGIYSNAVNNGAPTKSQ